MTRLITIVLFLFFLLPETFSQVDLRDNAEMIFKYNSLSSLDSKIQYINKLDKDNMGFILDAESAKIFKELLDAKVNLGEAEKVFNIALELSVHYSMENDFLKVLELYEELAEEIHASSDPIGESIIFNTANAHYYLGNIEESNIHFDMMLKKMRTRKDTINFNFADALLYLADNYSTLGIYKDATKNYEKAKDIYLKQSNIEGYFWAAYGQYTMVLSLDLVEEAERLQADIITSAMAADSEELLNAVYHTVANNNLNRGNYDDALVYARKSIDLCHRINDSNICFNAFNTITTIFINMNNLDSAEYYYAFLQETGSKYEDLEIHKLDYNITTAHLKLLRGDLQDVQQYLDDNLSPYDKLVSASYRADATRLQYTIDSLQGNYQRALHYLAWEKAISDSLYREVFDNQFSYYQAIYDINNENRKLAEQSAYLSQLSLKQKTSRLLGLAAAISIIFVILIIYFIKQKNRALKEQISRDAYTKSLLSTQEIERKRISRELHDSLGQSLALLKNNLTLGDLTTSEKIASKALEEVQIVSEGLHPYFLEKYGLTESIKLLINDIFKNSGIKTSILLDNIDKIIPQEHELNVYRILQETLNNILKHADAHNVSMSIKKQPPLIHILVSDDGRGFNIDEQYQSTDSLGLKTMVERAEISGGTFDMVSHKGEKTSVKVIIPFTSKNKSEIQR